MPDLVDNIPDLLKPHRLRRTHLTDAISIWAGTTEDAYTALDQTAAKADLITAINALIETFRGTLLEADFASPEDFDTFNNGLDQLKIDQAAEVNTGITTTVSLNISDVITDARTQLDTAFAAYEVDSTQVYPFTDGRCGGEGRYPAVRDVGETSEEDKHCASCDGIGRVTEQNIGQTTWTVTESYTL